MVSVWQEIHGVFTPGGDPCYRCPHCNEDEHLCGIESMYNEHHVCKNCGIYNIYPWEVEEKDNVK